MRLATLLVLASIVAPCAATAAPIIIFDDDFAEEAAAVPPGVGIIGNFTGLDSFTILDGSVDLFIAANYQNLPCPSAGCLDLDGSSSNAVEMETTPYFISGSPLVKYALTVNIGGNKRTDTTDTVTFGVRSGGFEIKTDVTLGGNEDFRQIVLPIAVPTSLDLAIFFDHQGGDNIGLILDRVTLTATPVPLPATAFLLGGALALVGVAGRRRA